MGVGEGCRWEVCLRNSKGDECGCCEEAGIPGLCQQVHHHIHRPGDGLEADAKQMPHGYPGDHKVGEGLPVLVSPLIQSISSV